MDKTERKEMIVRNVIMQPITRKYILAGLSPGSRLTTCSPATTPFIIKHPTNTEELTPPKVRNYAKPARQIGF